jgi:hypothetical protein
MICHQVVRRASLVAVAAVGQHFRADPVQKMGIIGREHNGRVPAYLSTSLLPNLGYFSSWSIRYNRNWGATVRGIGDRNGASDQRSARILV